MLIIRAMALEEDVEVLGRLIQNWGKDSTAYNCFFKECMRGKKVSVPLPNLLVCSLGHLRPYVHIHTCRQGSQPFCRCGAPNFVDKLGKGLSWEQSLLQTSHGMWNTPFLHQAFQGPHGLTRNTPSAQLASGKQPKSPAQRQASQWEPLGRGRQDRGRFLPDPTVGSGIQVASWGWQRSLWKAV